MTATDELRRMLEERGEHYVHDGNCVTWSYYSDPHTATESMDGTLIVTGLTPEQAIAATLGNSRADYHGYEQAAIEAWESIKAWNSRAERTCEMEPTFINPQAFENVQEFTCTACGRFAIVEQLGDDEDRPNYCPNCGARIVGRDDR